MLRVFGFKKVDAPWIGPDATVRRVDLRDALRHVPYRMCELARDGVYWTRDGNTYVMVEGEDFYQGDLDRKVDVLSINGCGETRWHIGVAYDGSIQTATRDDMDVLRAFGLVE